MSLLQTKTDLEAAARAIREHDRFLITTHENPDGDALGSILAAKLALDTLGKDAVMYLYGQVPLPAEYGFMPLEDLRRELRTTRASASSSPSTAPTRAGSGRTTPSCSSARRS